MIATAEFVYCPNCSRRSSCVYRCEHDGCGRDLTNEPTVTEPVYRSVAGVRDDGLVEVRLPRICCQCETRRYLPLDYADLPAQIRFYCDDCDEPTSHRPTDTDLRRRVQELGFDAADADDEPATNPDQTSTVSTARL